MVSWRTHVIILVGIFSLHADVRLQLGNGCGFSPPTSVGETSAQRYRTHEAGGKGGNKVVGLAILPVTFLGW